jgi:hypothetical protein
MGRRDSDLIADIEQDALDEGASIAGALRKCVVLGGKSGSTKLRDWATRELKGYYGEDDLPSYRVVPAQIQIDGATISALVNGQPIARSSLPDFVQERVREEVELRDGVGALEALAAHGEAAGESVKLSLPMGGEIARLMSAETPGQQVLAVYWAVTPPALRGVLDQVRTALTVLVGELRANMPPSAALPSPDAADAAVQVVVTGKRHKVMINTASASGPSSEAKIESTDALPESGFWTRSRRIGAFVVGIATIVGAVAAVLAVR